MGSVLTIYLAKKGIDTHLNKPVLIFSKKEIQKGEVITSSSLQTKSVNYLSKQVVNNKLSIIGHTADKKISKNDPILWTDVSVNKNKKSEPVVSPD